MILSIVAGFSNVKAATDTYKLGLSYFASGYYATEYVDYTTGNIVNWDGKLYNKTSKEFKI